MEESPAKRRKQQFQSELIEGSVCKPVGSARFNWFRELYRDLIDSFRFTKNAVMTYGFNTPPNNKRGLHMLVVPEAHFSFELFTVMLKTPRYFVFRGFNLVMVSMLFLSETTDLPRDMLSIAFTNEFGAVQGLKQLARCRFTTDTLRLAMHFRFTRLTDSHKSHILAACGGRVNRIHFLCRAYEFRKWADILCPSSQLDYLRHWDDMWEGSARAISTFKIDVLDSRDCVRFPQDLDVQYRYLVKTLDHVGEIWLNASILRSWAAERFMMDIKRLSSGGEPLPLSGPTVVIHFNRFTLHKWICQHHWNLDLCRRQQPDLPRLVLRVRKGDEKVYFPCHRMCPEYDTESKKRERIETVLKECLPEEFELQLIPDIMDWVGEIGHTILPDGVNELIV